MKTILCSTKRNKFLASLLLTMLMLFLFAPLSAFAEIKTSIPESDKLYLESAYNEARGDINTVSPFAVTIKPEFTASPPPGSDETLSATEELISYSAEDGFIFNDVAFRAATDSSRKDALAAVVHMLQESNVSEQTQQDIISRMQDADRDVKALLIPIMMDNTSADIFTALRIVAPALPIIRVIFGIGAIGIVIFLFASTIADLVFIGLPLMREKMQNNADSKGKSKIPFISPDALSVVNEVESGLDSSGGYQNAYVLYFKRRVWTYVIISICILYLVIGELGGLMSWLMTLGSGLVN